MITQRTKVQLIVFVIISLVGVTYVGARYARLDTLFMETAFPVTAHFAESGGAFEGAEVTYRGVTVGEVTRLKLVEGGVDMTLEIEDNFPDIPQDSFALVGNRSAVGEQYVELQPQRKGEPFLKEGSQIPRKMTGTPIATTKLLTDLDATARSVNKKSLRTVVSEAGKAFHGTGDDLGTIIDTSTSFIQTANQNFDITRALIRDSDTVLTTQVAKRSAIRSFSKDLALFSQTLADNDPALRKVIDNGSATANQVRTFLEQNRVDLGQLINNLVTTGRIVVRNLDGIEQVLVVFPYVVAGGFTVVAKDPNTGKYDAHFGAVLTSDPPVCQQGYGEPQRSPQDLSDKPMDYNAQCTAPAGQTNPRGTSHAPRAGAAYRSPVIGTYDQSTGTVRFGEAPAGVPDSLAPDERTALGSLLLGPVGQ